MTEWCHSESARRVSLSRLLQLTSPALPLGGFAYSQGLEQASNRGWVTDAPSLEDWLLGRLRHCVACTDLPLLGRHYLAWKNDDEAAVWRWTHVVHALRDTSESQREEQHFGSSLARVLVHLGTEKARPFMGHPDVSYVGMFALAAVSWQLQLEDAMTGYAFAWLENQLGVATRLLPVGQLAAQAILSRSLPEIESCVERASSFADDEIGYVAQGVSMASSWHERQYSRLFRS